MQGLFLIIVVGVVSGVAIGVQGPMASIITQKHGPAGECIHSASGGCAGCVDAVADLPERRKTGAVAVFALVCFPGRGIWGWWCLQLSVI